MTTGRQGPIRGRTATGTGVFFYVVSLLGVACFGGVDTGPGPRLSQMKSDSAGPPSRADGLFRNQQVASSNLAVGSKRPQGA